MPRFGGAFCYEPPNGRANVRLSIRAENTAHNAPRAAVLAISTD
jgi:hypothetical protein